MCGRAYSTYTAEELEMRYLNKRRIKLASSPLKPNYNFSPTQLAPVVFMKDSQITIELMRWGLVPSWAKSIQDASKYSLINAKGEEITEKRSYKNAFKSRRCIVPLSGFFEWHREENGPKRPYAIHLRDGGIMSLAGIWEHWKSAETGDEIHSFTVITTTPNSVMEKIHHRIRLMLESKDEQDGVKRENAATKSLPTRLPRCRIS